MKKIGTMLYWSMVTAFIFYVITEISYCVGISSISAQILIHVSITCIFLVLLLLACLKSRKVNRVYQQAQIRAAKPLTILIVIVSMLVSFLFLFTISIPPDYEKKYSEGVKYIKENVSDQEAFWVTLNTLPPPLVAKYFVSAQSLAELTKISETDGLDSEQMEEQAKPIVEETNKRLANCRALALLYLVSLLVTGIDITYLQGRITGTNGGDTDFDFDFDFD